MLSIDLFVKNWASKQAMVPISLQDIADLERKLAVPLPKAYKYLLTTYGLVHTPNVLTMICDLGSDITEVQDFLNLEDVFTLTNLYEMTGMPKGHILFASDCKGNMFCFKATQCLSNIQEEGVWFFNRSLGTVEQTSDSFTRWLDSFNNLSK